MFRVSLGRMARAASLSPTQWRFATSSAPISHCPKGAASGGGSGGVGSGSGRFPIALYRQLPKSIIPLRHTKVGSGGGGSGGVGSGGGGRACGFNCGCNHCRYNPVVPILSFAFNLFTNRAAIAAAASACVSYALVEQGQVCQMMIRICDPNLI